MKKIAVLIMVVFALNLVGCASSESKAEKTAKIFFQAYRNNNESQMRACIPRNGRGNYDLHFDAKNLISWKVTEVKKIKKRIYVTICYQCKTTRSYFNLNPPYGMVTEKGITEVKSVFELFKDKESNEWLISEIDSETISENYEK